MKKMTNKEIFEDILIDCEYYGRDTAKIYLSTIKIKSIFKDLEILEILKENAIIHVNMYNENVKSIQINITTCDDNFNKVEEWLDGRK